MRFRASAPVWLAIERFRFYRGGMGRQKDSSRKMASRIGEGLAEFTATAAAFRAGWQRGGQPRDQHDRMTLEYEQQQQQYHRAQSRYRSRLSRLRSRVRYMSVVAGAGAAAAIADFVVAGPEALFFVGAPVAVVGAVSARSAKRQLETLQPPQPLLAPPPPPRPLPEGVIGAAESAHLHQVRLQLASLVPTIADLHQEAALELRRADWEAAPAMAALVQRLELLHRVNIEMAGTPAQETALASAEQIRRRLQAGVGRYDELLNAALQMLSAPDPSTAPSAALENAVFELAAYTEGLRAVELAEGVADPGSANS